MCCAQSADLSPEEVTRLNMDKSALLQRLIQEYGGDPLMLLGELQVSASPDFMLSNQVRQKARLGLVVRDSICSGHPALTDWQHTHKNTACHLAKSLHLQSYSILHMCLGIPLRISCIACH